MVYYSENVQAVMLKSILMLVGQESKLIGDQLLATAPMSGAISSLEEAKSKLLSLGVVLSQNTMLLHLEYVKECSCKNY